MAERLIVGVSGASGVPLAVEQLRQLREKQPKTETHLVVSRDGVRTPAVTEGRPQPMNPIWFYSFFLLISIAIPKASRARETTSSMANTNTLIQEVPLTSSRERKQPQEK